MRDLKIKLLDDFSNKGKGSVVMMKGNRAARLINRKKGELTEEDLVIYPSKALKDYLAKKKAAAQKKK